MLEMLVLTIIKTVVSTCVKYYVMSLLQGGGNIVHNAQELGYRVPSWYMNPDAGGITLYAYGTSTEGDEFESITAAREQAVKQMAETIRLSTRAMVAERIKYDASSLKQQRLIDLFIRGEGLEDFIRLNAKVDKKQLVKVSAPAEDMRAFVRIALAAKTYTAYQEEQLHKLRVRVTQQKTEDIMAEMDAEVSALQAPMPQNGADTPAPTPDDAATPAPAPATPPASGPASGPFGEMERELENATAP